MKKWQRKKSRLVFDTEYFKVRKDTVKLPNNKLKEWTYWDSVDSAMVVGMTQDRKSVMIRQYRYLVNNEVIEFPSGALLINENAEVGAKREFEEETGYICRSLIKLGSFYETYGQLNRQIHIFFSNNISQSKQKLDRGNKGFEDIKVELIDFEKVVSSALNNRVVAMGSSLAILLLKEKVDRDEIQL